MNSDAAEELAECLFFRALQLPQAEHIGFLNLECGSNRELRSRVEALLRGHYETDSFLKIDAPVSPVFEAAFSALKPEQPGDRIGAYKLLQQIGEGGFGRVWVAEQERPIRRRVALKIIKLGMDTKEVIARFEQERQALAMMDHPNIAKVLDAGATNSGRPYFVMELVRGTKITDYCDEAELSTKERLTLFVQVCLAVQHAHQKGIIHRDLKPSNILVTLHDGVPVPKVIDFGVAKATQQLRLTDLTIYTQFEQMIGTPLYMAPEQAEMSGLDIDTRSDIYSLGVLLYELLTGRTPFDPERLLNAGFDEMRRVIREEVPQKPSTFVSTMAVERRSTVARLRKTAEGARLADMIRGDLDWIVMKALEKDRARRFETADALARDITRHLNFEPVQARPPSVGYRFSRFVSRNKGVATAAAAVIITLVAGTAVSLWQAFRANSALDELRSSAPAFIEQAHSLAARERFEESMAKLDYAIKLRPDVLDYRLRKADLLQSRFRFSEAASLYRYVLRLNPASKKAASNAALCEDLAKETAAHAKLSRESLLALFNAMDGEQRPAAEMLMVGRKLEREKTLLRNVWLDRLKDLPIAPDKPLERRLTSTDTGLLALDLSGTSVENLSALRGMPLERLILAGCQNVTDLRPLEGMPLKHLVLGRNNGDLSAAAFLPCGVRELSALVGLPLVTLDLEGMKLDSLEALRGMPLEWLNLRETNIYDLTALKGMPLRQLDCTLIRARDYTSLRGAPMEVLNLQSTPVGDLGFLQGMPLKSILLNGCVEALGYKVLSEIQTLETAMLPTSISELPVNELEAIGHLRAHPTLRRIQIGGSRQEGMAVINTEANTESFWKRFDEDLYVRRCLAALLGERGRFKRLKTTWEVYLREVPLNDISLLKDIPISTLELDWTNVTDLTPLSGMGALRRLYLSGTGVQNLEPLRGLRIVELHLDGCAAELDLTPLLDVPTLQHLLLPAKPRNLEALRDHRGLARIAYEYDYFVGEVPLTAEEFWDSANRTSVESAARGGNYRLAEELLRRRKVSDNVAGPDYWISLGAVVLAQGDNARYRAFCREAQVLATQSVIPPAVAAMICLLGPESGLALSELERLLESDATSEAEWKTLARGLLECRNRQYDDAMRTLQRIHPRLYGAQGLSASASAVVSMSNWHEGNYEAAKAELSLGRRAGAAVWPERLAARERWYNGLIAHLLLSEAEQLLRPRSSEVVGP